MLDPCIRIYPTRLPRQSHLPSNRYVVNIIGTYRYSIIPAQTPLSWSSASLVAAGLCYTTVPGAMRIKVERGSHVMCLDSYLGNRTNFRDPLSHRLFYIWAVTAHESLHCLYFGCIDLGEVCFVSVYAAFLTTWFLFSLSLELSPSLIQVLPTRPLLVMIQTCTFSLRVIIARFTAPACILITSSAILALKLRLV